MFKVVIIDDELASQDVLIDLLKPYENFLVAGTASSVKEGVKLVQKTEPDLIFLDVQMTPYTGFDLLTKLTNELTILPQIIFVTAYDAYAIRAIKFNALDYILKPVDIEDLDIAIKNFEASLNSNENIRVDSAVKYFSRNEQEKIVLPINNGFKVIRLNNILFCEADRNYTIFRIEDGSKIISTKSLKYYDDLFCDLNFFRIHQSYLINLDFVTSYKKGDEPKVEINGVTLLPVSRNKKSAFTDLFRGK